MAVSLNIGKCSVIGNYRENNEDSVEVKQFTDMTVCVVADGMGGQAAGETASRQAIEVVPRELKSRLYKNRTAEDVRNAVRKAVVQANEEIITMGQLDPHHRNMGTTVVLALWLHEDRLFIAGLGDSRAYLIRDNHIEQLTTDHSLAQALVEAKTISPAEAREHRFRNVLWKYLGSREVGEGPDVLVLPIRPGDRVLLCTDGLSGVVPDDKILAEVQAHQDPQKCADELCQLALDSGSRDNVSTLLIEAADKAP